MNTANRNTSSWISVRPPAQLPTASLTCAHWVAVRPPGFVCRILTLGEIVATVRDGHAVRRRFDGEGVQRRAAEAALRRDGHLVHVGVAPRTVKRLGTPAFHPKRATRCELTACVGSPGFGINTTLRLTNAANRSGLRSRETVEERVGHRVHETEAEQRLGSTTDVANRCVRGLLLLRHAAEGRIAGLAASAARRREIRIVEVCNGEQLTQRAAELFLRVECSVQEDAEAAFDLLAGTAERAVRVAGAARSFVEDGTDPLVDAFDRGECLGRFNQQIGIRLKAGEKCPDRLLFGIGNVGFRRRAAPESEHQRGEPSE